MKKNKLKKELMKLKEQQDSLMISNYLRKTLEQHMWAK